MSSLLSKGEMNTMDSGDDSYHDHTSMEILKKNCDGSQSHPNVNRRESHYKIHDRIKQIQSG